MGGLHRLNVHGRELHVAKSLSVAADCRICKKGQKLSSSKRRRNQPEISYLQAGRNEEEHQWQRRLGS